MDINFELYKIFYCAAKFESFSEAAKELFITQSAVSQAIKNLEEKLGGQLFFRKSRKVKLTWEGELLFTHIEQAYHFIKGAETKFYEMKNLTAGEIRIGASDTACRYFLMDYLQKFNTAYPNVKIHVTNRTSEQILDLLKKGVIELGIATLPVTDPSIVTETLWHVQDIFVACHKYSELKNKVIPLEDLSRYPLLMLEKHSKTRQNIDSFLQQQHIQLIPEIELENIDLLVEFAKIGLGIACVMEESASDPIEKGHLFRVNTSTLLPIRNLGICSIRNVPLSASSKKFIDMLYKIE